MRNCKALLILRSNVAKEDHTIQRIGIVGTKVTWFFKHLRMGKWWWCWVRFLPYPSGETRILELLLWQFLVQVVDLGSASHTATNPTYIYISSGISLPRKLYPSLAPQNTPTSDNHVYQGTHQYIQQGTWRSSNFQVMSQSNLKLSAMGIPPGVFLQNPCCLRQKLDEENTWEPVQVVTWNHLNSQGNLPGFLRSYCRIGMS